MDIKIIAICILVGITIGIIGGFYFGSLWTKENIQFTVRKIKNKGDGIIQDFDTEVNVNTKGKRPRRKRAILRRNRG